MSNALKDRNAWHISRFSEQLVSVALRAAAFIILPDFSRIAADLHAYAAFALSTRSYSRSKAVYVV